MSIFTGSAEPFADWDETDETVESIFAGSTEPFSDWDETK